jgi:hypothetical protein
MFINFDSVNLFLSSLGMVMNCVCSIAKKIHIFEDVKTCQIYLLQKALQGISRKIEQKEGLPSLMQIVMKTVTIPESLTNSVLWDEYLLYHRKRHKEMMEETFFVLKCSDACDEQGGCKPAMFCKRFQCMKGTTAMEIVYSRASKLGVASRYYIEISDSEWTRHE